MSDDNECWLCSKAIDPGAPTQTLSSLGIPFHRACLQADIDGRFRYETGDYDAAA